MASSEPGGGKLHMGHNGQWVTWGPSLRHCGMALAKKLLKMPTNATRSLPLRERGSNYEYQAAQKQNKRVQPQ
eukprot:scaffold55923_cov25-Tisochrysis_lutea.AAC.3